MYSAANTMTSEYPNGCAMRMLADGTEEDMQHHIPQTYPQCGTPPHGRVPYSLDQCPICFLPCPYEGDHERVFLNSCGHVYGRPCITQWIEQQKANAKCPNCNKKCKLRDVKKIYASPAEDQVTVAQSRQRMKTLQAENVSLKASNAALIDMGKLNEVAYKSQLEENKRLKAMCIGSKKTNHRMFRF